MKKMMAVGVVLVAAAGIPFYFTMSGGDLGISPEHRLGEREKVEAWLFGKKFKKTDKRIQLGVFKDVEDVEEDSVRQYLDTATSSYRGANHRVTLVLDGAGKIRGFGGEFYSGSREIGYPLSRTETFTQELWREIFDRDPVFAEVETGEGVSFGTHLIAEASKNGVRGRWLKYFERKLKDSTIVDFVTLFVD